MSAAEFGTLGVSILVFLELAFGHQGQKIRNIPYGLFQSLFFWNSPSDDDPSTVHPIVDAGFNPCFFGTRLRTFNQKSQILSLMVSILVFLELAFGLLNYLRKLLALDVSILVFLELAFGRGSRGQELMQLTWFQSLFFWNSPSDEATYSISFIRPPVSILVFLELAFGPLGGPNTIPPWYCFNPCFFGTRLRTFSAELQNAGQKMFQSLFFWNSPSDSRGQRGTGVVYGFQSLFFWNSPSDIARIWAALGQK